MSRSDEAFKDISAKMVTTLYNVISVVMHGDTPNWPLNGRTWRETEKAVQFSRRPRYDHTQSGFYVPKAENDDYVGGIPVLNVIHTDEYMTTDYVPDGAPPNGDPGYRTRSFPIWYAQDQNRRGWLPSLGSKNYVDARRGQGVRAPALWEACNYISKHDGEVSPSGTPEMTLESEGIPEWLHEFVLYLASRHPWMDWRYFTPFREGIQLRHEELGLITGVDAASQTPRGITRGTFSLLPLSPASDFVTEQGIGGMSFREFFLYCMFGHELDVDVLQAKRDIEAGYPTAFGAAVHPNHFNVNVEQKSDGTWSFQIEVSDALLSYASVMDVESGDTFWRTYRNEVVDDDVSHFWFDSLNELPYPFRGYVYNRFTEAGRRREAASADPKLPALRGYGRMIGCVAEAVSAMLCIGYDVSRQEQALFSDKTDEEELRKGGFLACFPAQAFDRATTQREIPEACGRALAREVLYSKAVRESTDKGETYTASLPSGTARAL